MHKILLLFCGGTLVMERNEEEALAVPEKERAINMVLNLEPRLAETTEIEVAYIDNIDSTNMTPNHWDSISMMIADNYEKYDGFVITHGTDSMAYTASALSFSMVDLGKPVVLTGSQIPGHRLESDARRNFINAVKLAKENVSGVYIVFDKRIILGARASKVSESKLDGFSSINTSDHGEIRIQMRLSDKVQARHNAPLLLRTGFEPMISVVSLTPSKAPASLLALLRSDFTRGIVLQAYGSGNIPYSFHRVFEEAKELSVPLIVRSQCLNGQTAMKKYDVGLRALRMGVIEAKDMSLEATATKLMWALHHHSYEEIREVMHRNFVGEIVT